CMDCGSDSKAEGGSDNGYLDCGSDSEAKDCSDNSMVIDEGKQDFINPTDHRKFDLEDNQASLKLKDSNDETDVEALQVGDCYFFKVRNKDVIYTQTWKTLEINDKH
nr:pre-rRNA-processing protein TSR1 homolog [Tanacetum cinerariifolium]